VDVVAFEINNFKMNIVDNAMVFFTEKMSEFCRKKNREVDELKKDRDSEKELKL
jgi:hypothetical protein